MQENKYDDPSFFEAYGNMARSQKGLDGAGEWHALRQLLPDFKGKRVLDLGCGYGWHCRYAAENGIFVFSVEHPVFTAYGSQDWIYDSDDKKVHWPVDNYFNEGKRKAIFLGQEVIKYHRTLDSYVNGLLRNGFNITGFVEPIPEEKMLVQNPDWKEELRRPMMLIISSTKSEKEAG